MRNVDIYFACYIDKDKRGETQNKLLHLSREFTDHIELGQDVGLLTMDLKTDSTLVDKIFNVLEEVLDKDCYSDKKLMYVGHVHYGPWNRGLYVSEGKMIMLTGAEFIQATDREELEGEI